MRDYRFRGKRIDTGQWVYGFYAASGKKAYILTCRQDENHWKEYEIDPETVGQYIMTYCKKDLYEGDLFRHTAMYPVDYQQKNPGKKYRRISNGLKFSVKYGSFLIDDTYDLPVFCADFDLKDWEHCGNIYENPELLPVERSSEKHAIQGKEGINMKNHTTRELWEDGLQRWEESIDKYFGAYCNYGCDSSKEIENAKAFIRTLLEQARREERERCVGIVEKILPTLENQLYPSDELPFDENTFEHGVNGGLWQGIDKLKEAITAIKEDHQ